MVLPDLFGKSSFLHICFFMVGQPILRGDAPPIPISPLRRFAKLLCTKTYIDLYLCTVMFFTKFLFSSLAIFLFSPSYSACYSKASLKSVCVEAGGKTKS